MRYVFLFLIALLAFPFGCSSTPRRGSDAIARDPIKAVSPDAQRQFDAAVQQLELGQFASASQSFRMLQAEYPTDPIAQVAELYLARADLGDWQQDAQPQTLSVLAGLADDTTIDSRIRHAAGVYYAASSLDDRQSALKRLGDYPGPSLSPAILKRDRLMAWSVITEALALAKRNVDAIEALSNGFADGDDGEAADDFRSYARARAFGLIQQLPEDALAGFSTHPRSLFLRAIAGYELIRRGENADTVQRVRGELIAIGAEQKAQALPQGADTQTGPATIAVVVPTTGNNSAIGSRALNAALLGVGAMGDSPGHTTLVVVDSNQPIDAITSKLQDVSAFVGPLDQVQAAELAAWSRSNNTVMLAPVTELPEAFDTTWAFRNFLDAEAEPRAMANTALGAGLRRAAVVYPNIGYGRRLAAAFIETFQAGGGEVAIELEYDRSKSDYTKDAKRVAASRPQVVFMPDSDSKVAEVTAFLANANVWGRSIDANIKKSSRIHVVYLGTSLWQRQDLLRRAGSYVEGAIIPVWSSAAFKDAESKAFHTQYEQYFGQAPGDIEAFVYDSVKLLRLSLESHGLSDPDALRTSLSGQNRYVGVTGAGRFDEHGEPVRMPRMVKVKKGNFVPYTASVVDPEAQ